MQQAGQVGQGRAGQSRAEGQGQGQEGGSASGPGGGAQGGPGGTVGSLCAIEVEGLKRRPPTVGGRPMP